jgi:hypothetical protein
MTNDGYRMTNKIVGQGFNFAEASILLTTILYLAVSCAPFIWTQHARQKKAQKEFVKSLNVVEKSIETGTARGDEFNAAVDRLEEVSGIEGNREHQFPGTFYYDWDGLLKRDFRKWKEWYEDRKDKLFWDEKEKKIAVRGKGIQRKEFDMSEAVELTADILASYPDWCMAKSSEGTRMSSPDSNKELSVEQTKEGYQLVLIAAENGSSVLIDTTRYGFSPVDWDLASNKIVYFAAKDTGLVYKYGDIAVFDVLSQTKTLLGKDIPYSEPKWSPDGARVVFADFGRVFIADMATKMEAVVRKGGYPCSCTGFCWSPDGDELVFIRWLDVHREERLKSIFSVKLGAFGQ